jgi:epoxyqueuosine reductase
MNGISIKDKINQICPPDVYEIGFASLSGLLKDELAKYKYGISLARKLDDSVIDDISDGPTISYYNQYHRINNELNQKTEAIAKLLALHNIEAYPMKSTVEDDELDDDYKKTLRYFFSHKMIATRSGLGWIGKTDLLVTTRFGPRVRLSSILLTSSISESGTPVNESLCGNCNICVEHCPPQAGNGKLWSIDIDRNEFYDPFKCREYCRKISAEKIGKEISLCGICISICPIGRK